MNAPQGLQAFFRAYYHYKSGDWKGNQPFRLPSWTAEEMAKMPTYYVMDLDKTWAQTVAAVMPSPAEVAACSWLTDDDVAVYAAEFGRSGIQGGLNGYRMFASDPKYTAELSTFAGCTIDVPSAFIAGKSDWGVYQMPGGLERMQNQICTKMLGCDLVEGAGHWVQQEKPAAVNDLLLQFLQKIRR